VLAQCGYQLPNRNWNVGVRSMIGSGGLSWEAQEVLQKIKSFNRLPGAGIPLIQLNMRGWQREDC
jgi:hypothetical protein